MWPCLTLSLSFCYSCVCVWPSLTFSFLTLSLSFLQLRVWPSLTPEQQEELINNEESTVYCQAIHYSNRMVYMLMPLDTSKSVREGTGGGSEENASSTITTRWAAIYASGFNQIWGQLHYSNSNYIPIMHIIPTSMSKIPIPITKYQLSIPFKITGSEHSNHRHICNAKNNIYFVIIREVQYCAY